MLKILTSQLRVQSSAITAYYGSGSIYINNRNGNFELQINGTILYGNRAQYNFMVTKLSGEMEEQYTCTMIIQTFEYKCII